MPRSPTEEDLFQDSTMTFGQHLEELRTCLFRAIIGLAVCCIAGFYWGDDVVVFITAPVEKALKSYYEKAAADKALSPEQQALLRDAGYTDEADLKRIQLIVAQQGVSFKIISIDPAMLLKQLAAHAPADSPLKTLPQALAQNRPRV